MPTATAREYATSQGIKVHAARTRLEAMVVAGKATKSVAYAAVDKVHRVFGRAIGKMRETKYTY